MIHVDGFNVDVVDPTGAGDCFSATFVSLLLAGYCIETALKFANVSGALAVTKRGPMEGTSSLVEIQQFLSQHTMV